MSRPNTPACKSACRWAFPVRYLSDTLDSTVVLQGSASDRDLMLEENIADADRDANADRDSRTNANG